MPLIFKTNQGQLWCFNADFQVSTGGIAFFLDADDVYEPGYVEAVPDVCARRLEGDFIFFTAHRTFGRVERVESENLGGSRPGLLGHLHARPAQVDRGADRLPFDAAETARTDPVRRLPRLGVVAPAAVRLDRALREVAPPPERLFFFVLYGLSPRRMFFSGFLWNPNSL